MSEREHEQVSSIISSVAELASRSPSFLIAAQPLVHWTMNCNTTLKKRKKKKKKKHTQTQCETSFTLIS